MHNIIYKATNTITNQVYIGVTTKSIEERKNDHIQKSEKKVGSYFQEALQTYGIDAFTWEQIDIVQSGDELAKKEVDKKAQKIIDESELRCNKILEDAKTKSNAAAGK